MFACSLYPGDAAFRRQRAHRGRATRCAGSGTAPASRSWCGNNEIEQLNTVGAQLLPPNRHAAAANYDALFHRLLPAAVAPTRRRDRLLALVAIPRRFRRLDPGTTPTAAGEKRGDTHFWDVRHRRTSGEGLRAAGASASVSEFGMQSYSSPETQATFCAPGTRTTSSVQLMENHQKNRAGNQVILDYVSRRYRFPKSQADAHLPFAVEPGVLHADRRRALPPADATLHGRALLAAQRLLARRLLELHRVHRALAARCTTPRGASSPRPWSAPTCPATRTAIIGNYRRSTVRRGAPLHGVRRAGARRRASCGGICFTLMVVCC